MVSINLIRKYRFKTQGDFEIFLEKNITDKLDLQQYQKSEDFLS